MGITQQDVEAAWKRLSGADGYAGEALKVTGVPGMAVAVVYQGKVFQAAGFGRETNSQDAAPVDADTVFQIASLSKPITTTIVAALVSEGIVKWDDPVTKHDPDFQLSDPEATAKVTLATLFAHRSGLPDHAGDLLEDMGYSRGVVLHRLRYLALSPPEQREPRYFSRFAYTNFGFTVAALAAARAAKDEWEALADSWLYRPLGMHSTSSCFKVFRNRRHRARPHQRHPFPRAGDALFPPGSTWHAPPEPRIPDAQSPAGGVSSTVNDLAQWMRLQLGAYREFGFNENFPQALKRTHERYTPDQPYGLGWNVDLTSEGELHRLSHSGAFLLGAATSVALLPREGIGIVVLTNGQPVGVPEAICQAFLADVERDPKRTSFKAYLNARGDQMQSDFYPVPKPDYERSTPPSPHHEPGDAVRYDGTYEHAFYGPIEVIGSGDEIIGGRDRFRMRMGCADPYPLTSWDRTTFTFEPRGENALGKSGVTFGFPPGSAHAQELRVDQLTEEYLDEQGKTSSRPVTFVYRKP